MKLSIIIPVYNVEDYIENCIESAITNYNDYEIIAVNDGSTDSSELILRKIQNKYSSILKVITTDNQGSGPARNIGINNASGKYILFMDSDDMLADGALDEILEVCNQEFDICLFDALSVNNHGDILKYERGSHKNGEFTLEKYPQVLYEFPAPWNKLFRRSLFILNNISFPKRVWFEDLRVCSKLYYYAQKIIYISKPWYLYLQHKGQITNSKNDKRNLEIIEAIEDIKSFYNEKGLLDKYKHELEYMAYYNELLTSTDRVNLINYKSTVQDELLLYFIENYPNYRNNKYFIRIPLKYRIINYLIFHRYRKILNILLKANNLIHLKYV